MNRDAESWGDLPSGIPPSTAHLGPSTSIPFSLLTVVVLFHGERLLLLRRAAGKTFAPNRWTGLGGKVEPTELGDLAAAARRELFEETDLAPHEVGELRLRRTLTFAHPAEGLVCLLYFTAPVASDRVPACPEGTLAWVVPPDLPTLDIIDNTARVFGWLVEDLRRDDGRVRCGFAHYDEAGRLERVVFDE